MSDKYKYLIKNILLFFIADFIPKIISFLLLPLYTSSLTTYEYGVSDLLSNIVSLVTPILTLQIQDSIIRFALDKDYRKNDVYSTGVILIIGGSGVLGSFLLLYSALFGHNYPSYYYWFIFLSFLVNAFNGISTYFCRGIDKVRVITQSSLLNSLTVLITSVLFLKVFNLGLLGYLASYLLGYYTATIFILAKAHLFHFVNIRIDLCTAKKMIAFSVPLIVSALSWWINNASDRYILTIFRSVDEVGIYSVASKIPTILSTCGLVISKAYSISAIKEFDYYDRDGFIGNSYSLISAGMSIACSILIIFNPFLSRILYSNDFYVAWHYVPFLLLSVLINQIALTCQNILFATNSTKIISSSALIGAGINTILNFAFIPKFGAYGAAIATVIGFTFCWLIRYIALKRIVRIKNKFYKELFSYLALLIQVIIASFYKKTLLQIVLFLTIILLYSREIKGIMRDIKKKVGNYEKRL